jgi:hypothetical protein
MGETMFRKEDRGERMKPVDEKQGQKLSFIIANELADFQPATV